jgi:hypothetical protein
MNDQVEPHLSMLFSETQMQKELALELSPSLYKLTKALSRRYHVPVDEADLIVCVSSVHALALSLLIGCSRCYASNERAVLASFITFASAIIAAEDIRRKTDFEALYPISDA